MSSLQTPMHPPYLAVSDQLYMGKTSSIAGKFEQSAISACDYLVVKIFLLYSFLSGSSHAREKRFTAKLENHSENIDKQIKDIEKWKNDNANVRSKDLPRYEAQLANLQLSKLKVEKELTFRKKNGADH